MNIIVAPKEEPKFDWNDLSSLIKFICYECGTMFTLEPEELSDTFRSDGVSQQLTPLCPTCSDRLVINLPLSGYDKTLFEYIRSLEQSKELVLK